MVPVVDKTNQFRKSNNQNIQPNKGYSNTHEKCGVSLQDFKTKISIMGKLKASSKPSMGKFDKKIDPENQPINEGKTAQDDDKPKAVLKETVADLNSAEVHELDADEKKLNIECVKR